MPPSSINAINASSVFLLVSILVTLLSSKLSFHNRNRYFRLGASIDSSVSFNVESEVGVSFSPAGLLTPFHIGASFQLRKLGFISSNTALAGSSGGALAAVTTALNIEPTDSLRFCRYIAQRCRDEGPRLTLRKALDEVLEEVIQQESVSVINNRIANCIVAYFEVFPSFKPQFVHNFINRTDLIDTLRASCNIPFYFNGNVPYVSVRGGGGVDGFFTVDLPRFGCPPTGSIRREIIVCPYPASTVGLVPDISTCNYLNHRSIPQQSVTYDVITPDLLPKDMWPYSPLQVLGMSIAAPLSRSNQFGYAADDEIEEIYQQLFTAGVQAVQEWDRRRIVAEQEQRY